MTHEPPLQKSELRPVERSAPVCYFLGAGFSAACCARYPVSIGFLTRGFQPSGASNCNDSALQLYDSEEGTSYVEGLLPRLERQFGVLDKLNLEDVMTDLHIRAFGLGRAWEHARPRAGQKHSVPDFRRDYEVLLQYIVDRLWVLDRAPGQHARAKKLAESLHVQDSVITLNYDTIVERHLPHKANGATDDRIRKLDHSIGPPSIGLGEGKAKMWDSYGRGSPGVLAKLHGSIDWLSCPDVTCPYHPYITRACLASDTSKLTPTGARCNACASGAETVIVPPTTAKVFDRFPKLKVMWLQAYYALVDAQRWTFVGVSFAPTDFHLSALIRSASRDAVYIRSETYGGQICIVNRDRESAQKAAGRLLRSLAPDVRNRLEDGSDRIAIFASLDEYLDAVARVDQTRESI